MKDHLRPRLHLKIKIITKIPLTCDTLNERETTSSLLQSITSLSDMLKTYVGQPIEQQLQGPETDIRRLLNTHIQSQLPIIDTKIVHKVLIY